MRKIFIVPLLFASLYTQAQTKVSSVIAKAFSEKFPDAKNVKWGKENAKEYEAEFTLNGIKTSANYDMQGKWKETEAEIPIKDLPEMVVKSIREKYPSAIISGADKVEKADGKIIYEADIKINGRKREVELWEDGRFVK